MANANSQEYLLAEDLVPLPSDVSVFLSSKFDSVFLLSTTELVQRLGVYLAK